LDLFNIINMNGRVYDPLTAMFFSPDPFIQSAGDWKNYNRYSYCMNNPTRYIDPSGYRYADQMEEPMEILGRLPFTNHGGKGGGLSDWSNHQGSVSYNWDSGRYEYASGAEAGWGNAMRNQQIDVPATLDLGFQIAKQQGWAGDYNDFTTLYSQRTAKNSYNGTFTLHTFESFYVTGGAGSKQTGSISLILEKGLGGSGSYEGNGLNLADQALSFISATAQTLQTNGITNSMISQGASISKYAGPASFLVNGVKIYNGYKKDGNHIGYNTKKATTGAIGGWAGGLAGFYAGASVGLEAGFEVGLCFEGVGAIPGAILGGIIGGFVGAVDGAYLGGKIGENIIYK
jgi:RHS repeat-associated protein